MTVKFTNGVEFFDLDAVKGGAVKSPGYYSGKEFLIATKTRSTKHEVGFVEVVPEEVKPVEPLKPIVPVKKVIKPA